LIDLAENLFRYGIVRFGNISQNVSSKASIVKRQSSGSPNFVLGLLTITTLMLVGLIPFSTNLAGDFPLNTHAVIIFEFNLLVIGLLSILQWNRVLNNANRVDRNVNIRMLILNRDEAYIFPVLSALAILLALICIPWGIFIYGVVPVYFVLMWLKEMRSRAVKQKSAHKSG